MKFIRMKTNVKNILANCSVVCFCMIPALISCSNEVDFGEQYKKTVYIVNSAEMLYTGEHFFEAGNEEIVISVYCASSEPIASDIRARLKVDRQAMDSLNALNILIDQSYVNKVMLPPANYQLDGEPYVTIKARTQYGTLRVPFDFKGLDPDVNYTLPITLVSNNADYDINPELRSIVYEVKMMNQFSGDFTGSSRELPAAIRGVHPTLKALSANTVRMPVHNLSSELKDINTNFMLLTIASDGAVTITPWASANVTDLGGSFYDAARQSFELHYQFTNAAGTTLTITEIITNINAPKESDEEN